MKQKNSIIVYINHKIKVREAVHVKDPNKQKINPNQLKTFISNAATDMSDTSDISEGQVPIASDECVEEARDWVNDGSKL